MALNGFIMFYKAKPVGSNNHTMASSKNDTQYKYPTVTF